MKSGITSVENLSYASPLREEAQDSFDGGPHFFFNETENKSAFFTPMTPTTAQEVEASSIGQLPTLPSCLSADRKFWNSIYLDLSATEKDELRSGWEQAAWSQVCLETVTAQKMRLYCSSLVRRYPCLIHREESSSAFTSASSVSKTTGFQRETCLKEVDAALESVITQMESAVTNLHGVIEAKEGNALEEQEVINNTAREALVEQGSVFHKGWMASRQSCTTFDTTVEIERKKLRFESTSENGYNRSATVLGKVAYYRASLFQQVRPITEWAGFEYYRPSRLQRSTCKVAAVPLTESVMSSLSLLARRCPPRSTQPWRYQAALCEELATYWKLQEASEARTRLAALKQGDGESFVEHVSLIQISAILEIMERTHEFMHRIGESIASRAQRLQSKEQSRKGNSVPVKNQKKIERNGAVIPSPTVDLKDSHAACPTSLSAAYQRFRAYMNSTKNEFRLVHTVETFVEAAPASLQATLLPHQMDGLRFLASLHANSINGILADEMGVGKTIQTIAFLLYLKEKEKEKRDAEGLPVEHLPHLVLAPLSVVREWEEACSSFICRGSFHVALFSDLAGSGREENKTKRAREGSGSKAIARNAAAENRERTVVQQVYDYDLILLPIHAVRYRSQELSRIRWNYVVVDEAHKAVANLTTHTAQKILQLKCERRLVLTGTPLSSDIRELWSLLFFLNPDVFSDHDSFEQVFHEPFKRYQCEEVCMLEEHQELLVFRLHQILKPFMLRRTKRDVCQNLQMTFHECVCPLTEMQEQLIHLITEQHRLPCFSSPLHCCSDTDSEGSIPSSCDAALVEAKEGKMAERSLFESREEVAELSAVQWPIDGFSLTGYNATGSTAQALCNHGFMHAFFQQVLSHGNISTRRPERPAASYFTLPPPTAQSLLEDTGNLERCWRQAEGPAISLACSGKFLFLHLFFPRVIRAGHKVVVFTHWLQCMDLLSDYFQSQGWEDRVEMLSGSTSEEDRKKKVRRFQEDPNCSFFVLSIKAGGCGVNLQAAHLILLLDRDYTSTNEDQALARVFRIGQKHAVRALALTTSNPMEVKVAARAQLKNKPRQRIIEEGRYALAAEEPLDAAFSSEKNDLSGITQDEADAEVINEKRSLLNASPSLDKLWSIMHGLLKNQSVCACTTDDFNRLWSVLREVVVCMDELVLTDEDRSSHLDRCATLHSSLPPLNVSEFHTAWLSEVEQFAASNLSCDSVWDYPAHAWWKTLQLLFDAMRGPRLFHEALKAALQAEARRNDPEYLRLEKEKKWQNKAYELRLLQLEPPLSFYEKCWEEGVTEESEIMKRFEKVSRE